MRCVYKSKILTVQARDKCFCFVYVASWLLHIFSVPLIISYRFVVGCNAAFVDDDCVQVAWYRIFGRAVTGGPDMKARLGDCNLLGAGEEVSDSPDNMHLSHLSLSPF